MPSQLLPPEVEERTHGMPSDYARISRENERKYGTEIGRIGPTLLGNRYADRAHFVFELLQNAEDALGNRKGSGGSSKTRFAVANGTIRFSHSGEPFTEQDVQAICGIVEGTKENDLTATGRFGIGFKSVYAVTDLPAVHSGEEHFAIRDYVHPIPVRKLALERGETVITLPLRDDAADALHEVTSQLERLGGERTLLFLREISEIEWAVEDGPSGCCRREEAAEKEGVRRVRLLSATDGEDPSEESWLVFSRPVQHDGERAGCVELAFSLASDDSGGDVIEAVDDSRLAAFFPTEIRTDLGMLVQGPYRTTPGRDNIPRDDDWNRYLVGETAGLLVDALRYLRDRGLLTACVFDALPLSRSRFYEGSRFAPFFDALREAVAAEPLLPAHRGGYVAASQARMTDKQRLRSLVSRQQLAELLQSAELLGEDEHVAWLAGEIAENTAPTLYRYLISEHGVEEFDTSDLLELLSYDEEFLSGQTDGWIQKLYSFLGTERARRRDLRGVHLIRLENGTQVALGFGTTPAAFLPTDPPSGFPNTVRREVCASKPALDFLKSIGLSKPDLIDELIRSVLPRYRNPEAIEDSEYADDLERITGVFAAASRERRERLTEALRETSFVRAIDAGTGESRFVQAADVYLRTKRLTALFDGVPVLLAARVPRGLRARDVEMLLEACGASRTLAPIEIDGRGRFSRTGRQRMREDAGQRESSRGESLTDWEFRGLQQLLEHLFSLPAEEGAERAGLLWDSLREAAARPGQPGFSGVYKWFYYTRWSTRFDSTSAQLLNQAAWVPDESQHFHPPGGVELATVGWTRDPFLESIIRFRQPQPPSKLSALSAETGVGRDALEALKEAQDAGFSDEEIGRMLRREARRMRARVGDSPRGSDAGTSGNGGERTLETGGVTRGVVGGGTYSGDNAIGRTASGSERVFESYIRVTPERAASAEGRDEHHRRMGIEEAAITRILDREPSLKRTPANNPGYDLYEATEDGSPVRWVEVKGLTGAWESGPVTLTHTQFDLAREKGEAYWLYVVEYAGTGRATIIRISNPAGRASTYTFDKGWRVAGPAVVPPLAGSD